MHAISRSPVTTLRKRAAIRTIKLFSSMMGASHVRGQLSITALFSDWFEIIVQGLLLRIMVSFRFANL